MPAAAVPGGGLSSFPPANPAFSLLSCPLSPFPSGEGGFLVFLCKGIRPLHPRWLNPGGTYSPCQAKHPAGGWFSSSPDAQTTLGDVGSNPCCTTSGQYYNRGKFLGVWGLLSRSPQRFPASSLPRFLAPSLPRSLASSLPRSLASLRIRSDCVTIRRGRTYHGNGSRPGRTTRTVCPSTAASCAGGAAHRHQPEEE